MPVCEKMKNKSNMDYRSSRRNFLNSIMRNTLLGVTGGALGMSLFKIRGENLVWQLDPYKCTQCGKCATKCVLALSAVKCIHNYSMCGYCKLCFGYFQPGSRVLSEAAENQVCPTGAIKRKFVEEPYFEYTIDEELCIGCAKCVKGCGAFGNGSLFLQVRHDRCLNCNECSIAEQCPADAFSRVSVSKGYIKKGADRKKSS
jgi:electron transport complex protein RnfB